MKIIDARTLCECGCGELAPLARKTNRLRRAVKGQPLRFIHGHNGRRHSPDSVVVDAVSGCWVWQGNRGPDGYGRIWVHGRTLMAHRA